MAVYERTWRGYSGPLTPPRARPWVLPRYALAEAFSSRLFAAFYALTFVPTIVCAVMVYFHHNLDALALLGQQLADLVPIDARFFHIYMRVQALWLGIPLAVLLVPGPLCRDLAFGGLPLYLGRPLSRRGYLAGRAVVPLALMSLSGWIPAFLIFLAQAWLAGGEWLRTHARLALAIPVAGLAWAGLLVLLGLAAAALTGRRIPAQALLVGGLLAASAFGHALSGMFHSPHGLMVSPLDGMQAVWQSLFGGKPENDLPAVEGLVPLAASAALALRTLHRKVRPKEEVK